MLSPVTSLLLCLSLAVAVTVTVLGPPGPPAASAGTIDDSDGTDEDTGTLARQAFWEERREGWFWYREVPRDEPARPPHRPPHRPLHQPSHWFDDLKALNLDQVNLERLPALELKWLVKAKRERALDNPTVAAVREYFLVHKATFTRSQRFTDSWELALIQEPALDFHSTHPTSALGHEITARMERRSRDGILAQFRRGGGLFFFFTSTCPYCRAQSRSLKLLADEFGLTVFPVTQDGEGLPEFPDARPDNGMGDNLGVSMVPALYLAVPGDHFIVPIGAGFLTRDEILRRIVTIWKARSRETRTGL